MLRHSIQAYIFLSSPGKFFCIPHSTECALEKYRYRRKADEILDTENRRQKLRSLEPSNEWNEQRPLDHIKGLSQAHKDRLLAGRESTPER
jgi:hypothetical protein